MIKYALRFGFRTSNNEAEYEALLADLRLAKNTHSREQSCRCPGKASFGHQQQNWHTSSCGNTDSTKYNRYRSVCHTGLDLINPMPQGKGQVKHAMVAVDYFTKWVKAEALATITATRIEDFVWTHICYRFSIPYAVITDKGRQFDPDLFW
ncbi:hypothetical protein L3X38_024667 [Prunus dulcis]|uniref:Integrase catalytic domain-containing protein n=1 Tax=Prunus dulcis TaxID=3755 RepID=A0AAD4W1U7_PRUDU|nr:hypothetical protein L3X38_024667 [Prunus dulcis]